MSVAYTEYLPISAWVMYGLEKEEGVARFHFLLLVNCPASGPNWSHTLFNGMQIKFFSYLKQIVVLTGHLFA